MSDDADLTPALLPDDEPELGFRQGIVIAWNGFTGENVIRIGGSDFTNLPIANTLEIFGTRVGDAVCVFRFRSMAFVLGRVIPGDVFDPTRSVAIIRDFSGNVLLVPDLGTEQGFARPYFAVPMHVAAFANPTNTTSAAFENLFAGVLFRQNPRVRCEFTAITPVGTTGEARLLVGGAQVGPTITIGSGAFANFTIGPAALADTTVHLQQLDVVLQGRRTGGAGNVGLWMRGVNGEA